MLFRATLNNVVQHYRQTIIIFSSDAALQPNMRQFDLINVFTLLVLVNREFRVEQQF